MELDLDKLALLAGSSFRNELGRQVIHEDGGWSRLLKADLLQQISEEEDHLAGEGKGNVLRLCRRQGSQVLLERLPGNQAQTNEDAVPSGGLTVIQIGCPVTVAESNERAGHVGDTAPAVEKAMVSSAFEVAQGALGHSHVACSRIHHVARQAAHSRAEIRPCKVSRVQQLAHHSPVDAGVRGSFPGLQLPQVLGSSVMCHRHCHRVEVLCPAGLDDVLQHRALVDEDLVLIPAMHHTAKQVIVTVLEG
mmetsp:Transcript_8433/g.13237  ORF Transcript_8433/g.13237 Transcript_8433/m.13237 type:complete len:249 (-) Transcript_8433:2579-3325(-)